MTGARGELERLLVDAEAAAETPPEAMAGRLPTFERILYDVADVLDATRDPAEVDRLEKLLVRIALAVGRATGRPDVTLEVSYGGRVHLVPRSKRATPRPRLDARHIDLRASFERSLLGRVMRETATGRLVARVDELEKSTHRIMSLPVLAAKPNAAKIDLCRQFELQLYNLGRIRDALAVAMCDVDALRRRPRPLEWLVLWPVIEAAEDTLRFATGQLVHLERWRRELRA